MRAASTRAWASISAAFTEASAWITRASRSAAERISAAWRRPSAVRSVAMVSRSARMRSTVAPRVTLGRVRRSMPTCTTLTP